MSFPTALMDGKMGSQLLSKYPLPVVSLIIFNKHTSKKQKN